MFKNIEKENKQRFSLHKLKRLQAAEDTLQTSITEARAMFEEKLICDFPNQYRVYRYIRNITESKSMPMVLYFGTQQGNNNVENTNLFKNSFILYSLEILIKLIPIIVITWLHADVVSPLKDLKFSDYEVYNTLSCQSGCIKGSWHWWNRTKNTKELCPTAMLSSLPLVYKVLRAICYTLWVGYPHNYPCAQIRR